MLLIQTFKQLMGKNVAPETAVREAWLPLLTLSGTDRSVCCPVATPLPRSVRVLHSYVSIVPLHTFLLFDLSFCHLLFIVLLFLFSLALLSTAVQVIT